MINLKKITLAGLALSFTALSTYVTANTVSSIQLSNNFKQGALIVGKTAANNIVKLNGKTLTVSDSGDFVFGFGRDENKTHTLTVTNKNGIVETKKLMPQKREYNIQRINGIKKSIMKPNPLAVTRSRKDNVQIKEARKTLSLDTHFANGFIAPIDGTVTGVYGSQRVFNGEKKRPHYGLDYAGKTGDPVKSPADGKILLFVSDMFYSGGTMIIDHGHGVTSTFLHLSKSLVKTGDEVKQGQVIANVGSSGRATGPHLDWRINWFDVRLDPAYVLQLDKL